MLTVVRTGEVNMNHTEGDRLDTSKGGVLVGIVILHGLLPINQWGYRENTEG